MIPTGPEYLYRGLSAVATLDASVDKALQPRRPGAFAYCFRADGSIRAGDGATAGVSAINAVLRHELRQEGFGSAGISTTPLLHRASFYALAGRKRNVGVVITIDRRLLGTYGVREFVVAAHIPRPSIPEDEEVILVAADCGQLPREIVVNAVQIVAEQPAGADRRSAKW